MNEFKQDKLTVTITIVDQKVLEMIRINNSTYERTNEQSVVDLLEEWANHYCEENGTHGE